MDRIASVGDNSIITSGRHLHRTCYQQCLNSTVQLIAVRIMLYKQRSRDPSRSTSTSRTSSFALDAKEEGNNLFRNGLYDEALEFYSKAITYCPEDDENKENLATFYGNRSAAYFILDEHELVVEDCTAALQLKSDYVKVLARRMLSYEKLEKYDEALTGSHQGRTISVLLYIMASTMFVYVYMSAADAKSVQDNDPSYPKINEKM